MWLKTRILSSSNRSCHCLKHLLLWSVLWFSLCLQYCALTVCMESAKALMQNPRQRAKGSVHVWQLLSCKRDISRCQWAEETRGCAGKETVRLVRMGWMCDSTELENGRSHTWRKLKQSTCQVEGKNEAFLRCIYRSCLDICWHFLFTKCDFIGWDLCNVLWLRGCFPHSWWSASHR